MKIDVNDSNFDEQVIKQSADLPVVVDFWAPWCMPCQMLGPVLENIAEKYEGKIIVAKVNVDKNPSTSAKYNVRSIPSVKLFKNGEIADEFIGALPESSIVSWIDKNI